MIDHPELPPLTPELLRGFVDRPRGLVELDAHIRRGGPQTRADLAAAVSAPAAPDPAPTAIVRAASHRDGRIRERAVRMVLANPLPELLPVLVLRTGDWAKQVREPARAGLARLLYEDPLRFAPPVASTALLLSARSRGGFAWQQLAAALHGPARVGLLEALLRSPDSAVRRFSLGIAGQGMRLSEQLALCTGDPSAGVRAQAAELAARTAVWHGQVEPLRRLAASPRREVRVTGLIGLLRLGEQLEVAGRLDDPSPLVRALAREAARKAGLDAAGRYREACRGGAPNPGAVDGLAEVGGRADTDLLVPLLTHPTTAVRARAARGVRVLGGATSELMVPLLRDSSSRVIREAVAALRPVAAKLPPDLARELLADPDRAVVRRAGFRLLHEPVPRLRLALLRTLAEDPDPRLARMAAAEATALARGPF